MGKTHIQFSTEIPGREKIKTLIKTINFSHDMARYKEEELQECFANKNIFSLIVNDMLVGIIGYRNINEEWIEIAPLCILEKFRRRGYAGILTKKIFSEFPNKNYFVIATNPVVKQKAEENGFQKVSFSHLPFFIKRYYLQRYFKPYKIIAFLKKHRGKISHMEYFLKKNIAKHIT